MFPTTGSRIAKRESDVPRLISTETKSASPVTFGPHDILNFVGASARFLIRHGRRLHGAHLPPAGHLVPEGFVGVCVASNADPACDEYVLQRLRDMNVRHVRLDHTYGSDQRHTARFLDFLLNNSIDVLLHVFQPYDDALAMRTKKAQQEWREFLERTLEKWGGRISAIEIGSTVNRRKWAGYTPETLMIAWTIAHEVVRAHSVTLAGPNVTDFEPEYNVALLEKMKAKGALPDVHTTNLFAERAVEPERYDHKILGRALAPLVKFNTIKKARLLHQISQAFGVNKTWSTHVAWSKRRIDRETPYIEEKQADYLSRYFVLAAASGALSRVYWGPLIGQREGIIDDGTDEYPPRFPHVTRYEHVYGQVGAFTERPALKAMRSIADLLPGATYQGRLTRAYGLEAHAFSTPRGVVHALWTINARAADPASLYQSADLADAEWISRDGETLPEPAPTISESPVFLRWPSGRTMVVNQSARPLPQLSIHAPVHVYEKGSWRGVVSGSSMAERDRLLHALAPEKLVDQERLEVLRDARNTVWRITDPLNPGESLVVKRWLLKTPHKRVLDFFKPSKARRSWNGACELLRRGVGTPRPVAMFEHTHRAVLKENFYICAFTPGGETVRTFFTAYAAGEAEHNGVAAPEFYDRYSDFLVNMHKRGVYFRDCSPGNILVEKLDGGALRFSMVDTARARFFERQATVRQSLADLKRTCHPLHWDGRIEFVSLYLNKRGEEFTALRRLPFALYDFKQRAKQRWKKFRRGVRASISPSSA